jgi:hypothetical protein
MMAESDGLLIRDYGTFWMGHKGGIEHTYTVNKGLSQDAIEKMRESYAKAAAKYLQTTKTEVGEDRISQTFKRQLLAVAGYTEQEIAKYDLAKITDEAPGVKTFRLEFVNPADAEKFYNDFMAKLRKATALHPAPSGIKVAEGRFAAMMDVKLVNDGPVTIILGSH